MFAVFLGLPQVTTEASGIAGFAFADLACSALFPLSVSLSARHFTGGAARASSLLTAALMIGVGLGSFAVEPLRSARSIATLYRVSALYPALAFALCLWLQSHDRLSPSEHALQD
jgi:predicted MFS family arabinose efflux permease